MVPKLPVPKPSVPKSPVVACLILCALALSACSAGQPPPQPLAQLSATLASLPDVSDQGRHGTILRRPNLSASLA